MAQACPSCGALNDAAAEVCFTCRAVLTRITLGSVIASRYELRRFLGRGGMGTVYLAQDRALDEAVAFKILRGDLAETAHVARRFRSEIKLARKVTHPSVCRIHDYGEDGQIHYISMELIDGPDLKHVVDARGALPTEQAYDIVIQLAEGLDAIHRVGIVHRDVKTRNIMLDAGGVVKLMDFGVAKRVGLVEPGTTAAGQIVGTPEYMSPEQARGERTDGRSDIYAVGIVLYEIFTGAVPFRSDTPVRVLLKQMNAPPPLEGPQVARLPPPLLPVLERMLAKEPADRYPTAAEMVKALRKARAECPSTGAQPPALAELAGMLSPLRALGADAAERVAGAETESWMGARGPGHANERGQRQSAVVAAPMPAAARPRRPLAGLAAAALLVAGAGFWLASRTKAPASREATLEMGETGAVHTPASAAPTPAGSPFPAAPAPPRPRDRMTPAAARPSERPRVDQRTAAAANEDPRPPAVAPLPVAMETVAPSPAGTADVGGPPPGSDREFGLLQIGVRPYADVVIDGTPMGTTPLKELRLPTGAHSVLLTHPDYRPFKRTVTIVAGQRRKLIVDLALDAIRR